MQYRVDFPWNGITRTLYNEIEQWCIDAFGDKHGKWSGFENRGINEFTFCYEADMLLFLLRWGHEVSYSNR